MEPKVSRSPQRFLMPLPPIIVTSHSFSVNLLNKHKVHLKWFMIALLLLSPFNFISFLIFPNSARQNRWPHLSMIDIWMNGSFLI